MALRIRRLHASDYRALITLFAVCGLNPWTKRRDSQSSIVRQLRANRGSYLGAFEGDRLVGAVLGTHDTRKGWINRLAVHPDFRRRGIAKRLVRRCEAVLRGQGFEMFAALIETENSGSAAFFRSMGYEVLPMLYARKKRRPSV